VDTLELQKILIKITFALFASETLIESPRKESVRRIGRLITKSTESIIGEPMVSKKRSLAKSLTWRAVAVVSTLLIGYAMTGSWAFAVSLTVVSNVINFVLYYIHERVWLKIRWGVNEYDSNRICWRQNGRHY